MFLFNEKVENGMKKIAKVYSSFLRTGLDSKFVEK